MYKLAILFLLFSNRVVAIDNPDTPNYVADFEKRLAPLYSYVHKKPVQRPNMRTAIRSSKRP